MPKSNNLSNNTSINNGVRDKLESMSPRKAANDFRPLDFVIGLNPALGNNQEEKITQSLLEFFKLTLKSNEIGKPVLRSDWLKTRKIIDALNFIRFAPSTALPNVDSSRDFAPTSWNPSPVSSRSSARSDRLLSSSSSASSAVASVSNDGRLAIPCFSLVLLTNSPSTCRPLTDQDTDQTDSTDWYYHYKIELNDDRGKPIARQVRLFF